MHLGMHYEAHQMFITGFSHKAKKMAKKVDGFLAALYPKYRVRGNLKVGVLVNGVWKGVQLGVAGTNM